MYNIFQTSVLVSILAHAYAYPHVTNPNNPSGLTFGLKSYAKPEKKQVAASHIAKRTSDAASYFLKGPSYHWTPIKLGGQSISVLLDTGSTELYKLPFSHRYPAFVNNLIRNIPLAGLTPRKMTLPSQHQGYIPTRSSSCLLKAPPSSIIPTAASQPFISAARIYMALRAVTSCRSATPHL